MKFTKLAVLSIALLTAAGAQANWLDSLVGNPTPAATPAQLGLPAAGAQTSNEAAAVAGIKQNIAAMIAKVQQMAPAITNAVTNKDFTSAAALAEPAKDLLTLGMSTAKSIQQLVATYPDTKGVVVGLVNQLTPAIAPLAAQVRTMAASAGWGASFVLKTIAAGLEQVPQLLTAALR